jgi:hypothetical protein
VPLDQRGTQLAGEVAGDALLREPVHQDVIDAPDQGRLGSSNEGCGTKDITATAKTLATSSTVGGGGKSSESRFEMYMRTPSQGETRWNESLRFRPLKVPD